MGQDKNRIHELDSRNWSFNTCVFSSGSGWQFDLKSLPVSGLHLSLSAGLPRGYQSPSMCYLSGFLSPLSYEGQGYKKPFDFSVTLTDLCNMFDSLKCNTFNMLRLDTCSPVALKDIWMTRYVQELVTQNKKWWWVEGEDGSNKHRTFNQETGVHVPKCCWVVFKLHQWRLWPLLRCFTYLFYLVYVLILSPTTMFCMA